MLLHIEVEEEGVEEFGRPVTYYRAYVPGPRPFDGKASRLHVAAYPMRSRRGAIRNLLAEVGAGVEAVPLDVGPADVGQEETAAEELRAIVKWSAR